MINAIIFDFDGVIVDSEPLHWEAFRREANQFNVDFDYDFYGQEMLGFDDRDAFRYLAKTFDTPALVEDLPARIQSKAKIFNSIVEEGIQDCPDATRIIREAYKRGKIAIASGALLQDIEMILKHLEGGSLRPLFQTIVTADMVEISKPHPETYAKAAAQIGVPASDCLAFEDTPHGIESAKEAGLKVVALAHTYPVERLQPTEADLVLETFVGHSLEQIIEKVNAVA